LKVVTLDESSIEEEYYEVEGIRDHRGEEGHREYLIKWKGYSEKENTWQKASDFTDPTIIQRYWNKQRELRRLEQTRVEQSIQNSEPNRRKKVGTSKIPKCNGNEMSNVAIEMSKNKRANIAATTSREERILNRRSSKKRKIE
jgi:hypothetical protein